MVLSWLHFCQTPPNSRAMERLAYELPLLLSWGRVVEHDAMLLFLFLEASIKPFATERAQEGNRGGSAMPARHRDLCWTCNHGPRCTRGTFEQLGLLEELARVVKDTTMCGLGQTVPNPVLSTLRYFRDEYLEHIENRRCPAGVCKELITYSVNENCTGCGACVQACPADAVTGEKKRRHTIDAGTCIRCGACKSACRFEAIDVT